MTTATRIPTPAVIDLFRGPGGWSEGLRLLGLVDYGVEFDKAAHDTAVAAGHAGILADVLDLDPLEALREATRLAEEADARGDGDLADALHRLVILIASPPCQTFSLSGRGSGRRALDDVLLALEYVATGRPLPTRTITRTVAAEPFAGAYRLGPPLTVEEEVEVPYFDDPRTGLVLEPLRWALELEPDVIVWEQVPPVLPVWEACAEVLRADGYSVATGLVNAEEHGVPQTRKRAILVARRRGVARLPRPTHTRYRKGKPRQEPGLLPWVSMADALEWGTEELVGFPRLPEAGRPAETVNLGGTDYRARDLRPASEPAQVVTEKARSWQRYPGALVPEGVRPEDVPALERAAPDEVPWTGPGGVDPRLPATTVSGDPRLSARSHHDPGEQGRGAVSSAAVREAYEHRANVDDDPEAFEWTAVRPSPTIVGSFAPDVVAAPGYRKAGDGPRQKAVGSVRVTVEEAAVLQSFPRDYPWQGAKTKRFQQVGNAVPPLLAAAIVAEVLGIDRPYVEPAAVDRAK